MKKFIISLFVCILTITANAQTIHWLTFIDTEDPNVGRLDINGRNVLYNHFVNVVNAALTEKGYNSDIHDIYGTDLSPERCKMEVQNIKCSPEDILVFYYIGHGTHAIGEDNPYPQMLLGSSDEQKFIPLKWVHEQLKSKGARLTLSIGMCCNVLQTASPKKGPNFGVNYGNVKLTDTEIAAIQKMFLGHKGDFILSSASVGQASLGGDTPLGAMDLFTAVLVSIFEDMAYDGSLDWNELFTEVRNIVNNVTGGKQTPFWENNLTSANEPTRKTTATPTPKQVNPSASSVGKQKVKKQTNMLDINDANAVGNYLSQYFDYIIDSRNSSESRREKTNELMKIFANNAVVRMMPQDGNTIIDREDIDTFLGRISTSRILLKIAPSSYRHDGKKILELRVREIFSK